MNHREIFLNNEYESIFRVLISLENDEESVKKLFFDLKDDCGLFALGLIVEVAYKRNISFWFEMISFLYQFFYHYIDGSQQLSLYYLIKAHMLDSNNTNTLRAILDFGGPPEIVLTEEQKKYYASKLLELEPENERALAIINS
ncbi:hypothetical protein [Psychrobacter sp. I-STPA6b]|uniref:hypothetical protein n=1 Tax=Psychrobacter sp. I-STPA6b TaxID=2585718 RepID=UPI001D0C9B6F|nr:hypothetical protein [Psychrobacter sp. I-STPA6b]